jgi:short-subunit dehydrogenase/catechol 2,3-dioxygenase-like lactoylglutathione lyase family enzyme
MTPGAEAGRIAEPPLCQVALSVADLRRAQAWYREVLGLLPAGGTNLFVGPLASAVQGLPGAASTCWWMVDRQDFFQLELFEFRSPPVRSLPPGWRPCDIGYTTLGVHVSDLDATLGRAERSGSTPLGEAIGPPGARRVCVRDPDGVVVELMEDDPRAAVPRSRPRPDVPAAVRGVTLSVPDLERSRRFFCDVLGLGVAEGIELHGAEHEALWELAGAERRSVVLTAGDFLVELVQYVRPAGKPWPPGYRISDRGLLNVALGFRDRSELDATYERCVAAGHESNARPLRFGPWSVVYVNDDQGFSVELLHVPRWYEAQMGFGPRRTPRVAPFAGRTPARRRAARTFADAVVTGAAGGLGTELCRLLADDGTDLVALDRDEVGLERLREELGERVRVLPHVVDFADLDALDRLAAELVAEHTRIDLLVAGAGLDRAQSLLDLDWRQAREDFNVNALANLVLLSHLLPAMAERGRAHVTAIASLAGLLGMPYEAPYSGSKAALAAITESARAELASEGVTFTTVFPGFVDTPMFRANAFKHPYSIPPRDAAERIHAATLDRRPTLHFPVRDRARIGLARLLPARLRDRLAREAMDPDRLARPTRQEESDE